METKGEEKRIVLHYKNDRQKSAMCPHSLYDVGPQLTWPCRLKSCSNSVCKLCETKEERFKRLNYCDVHQHIFCKKVEGCPRVIFIGLPEKHEVFETASNYPEDSMVLVIEGEEGDPVPEKWWELYQEPKVERKGRNVHRVVYVSQPLNEVMMAKPESSRMVEIDCPKCGKKYEISSAWLRWYKKEGIPLENCRLCNNGIE